MSSSLIGALSTGNVNSKRCPVGAFMNTLPEDEFNAIIEAMRRCRSSEPEDKNFTFVWLSKTLEENGKPKLGEVRFRRHMRGECSCDESTR